MPSPRPSASFRERVRSLVGSVGVQLFLWLTGLLVLAMAALTYVNVRTTSELWERAVLESAERFSDLIQGSTHFSMLLNRKEEVQHVIEAISQQADVDDIRVYDKQGSIIFSADAGEIARGVGLEAEACAVCHHRADPLRSVPPEARTRIYRREGGDRHRVLGLIAPIENSLECSSAPCHAHPAEQTILGVLDVEMSMARTDARLETIRRQAILATVAVVLLMGIVSALFIRRVVTRPVRRLIEGSQRIARGDLEGRIEIGSRDEIGQLGRAFNEMTRDLQAARGEIVSWSLHLEQMVEDKTKALEGALEELRDVERRKSHYMRISAHQLRSPLGTLKTTLRVLADGYAEPDSERGRRLLAGAVERTDGLLAIVNDLLELAKIREGRGKAPWSRNVDLGRIVRDVLQAARPAAEEQEVRLVSGTTDPAVLAWGVPTDLGFAVENLVHNAIKYSHSGGEVRVDLAASGGQATLTVEDHGIGIPMDLQRDVYLEFVRAPNARHHAGEGTGLGLTIVKEAVEMHGGTLSLRSKQHVGTTLIVTLPLFNTPAKGALGTQPAAE